jgi:hypothetical protein
MDSHLPRPIRLAFLTTLLFVLLAGTSFAGIVALSGSGLISRQIKTQTDSSAHSGRAFASLPGALVVVTVPTGASRLVAARFTAESQCSGPAENYCAVRIVAFNPSTRTILEFNPQAGINHVFHRTASDRFESHSIARAARLGPGSYSIIVQRATTLDAMTFVLDDWIFEVDLSS